MAPHLCANGRRPGHFEVRVCPACGFTLGYDHASDGADTLAEALTGQMVPWSFALNAVNRGKGQPFLVKRAMRSL